MNYYIFKVNLNSSIVKNALAADEMDYIRKTVIPEAFSTVYEVEKINDFIYKLNDIDNEQSNFEKEFKELEIVTKKLREKYEQTIDKFKTDGSVLYEAEFLSLITVCGSKRNNLTDNYPILERAYELYDDNGKIIAEYNIPTEYKVGKGISHLQKFYKIKKFIDTYGIDIIIQTEFNVYYNSLKEHILVEAEDDKEATNRSIRINQKLNSNLDFHEKVQEVSIVPVYEEFEIEEEITELEYTIVYPNGDSSSRHEVLLGQLVDIDGDEQTTIVTSQNNLDNESINETLSPLAQKGYLKNVKINSKKSNNKPYLVHKFIKDIRSYFNQVWGDKNV